MGFDFFFVLLACDRSLSALHAEIESLFWAASCMKDRRITMIYFETDCSDLVDMTTNPRDWSIFATEIEMFQRLHEDFEDVNLIYIPRSRTGRTDSLAREARTIGYIFSHIDQIRTDGKCFSKIWLV